MIFSVKLTGYRWIGSRLFLWRSKSSPLRATGKGKKYSAKRDQTINAKHGYNLRSYQRHPHIYCLPVSSFIEEELEDSRQHITFEWSDGSEVKATMVVIQRSSTSVHSQHVIVLFISVAKSIRWRFLTTTTAPIKVPDKRLHFCFS